MRLTSFLNELLQTANQKLGKMIDTFDAQSNVKLIEESRQIFDDIRLYVKIKENQIFPRIRHIEGYDQRMAEASEIHENIFYMMEKLVMIHVDEPYHEYREKLEFLKGYIDELTVYDQNTVFPMVRDLLSDEECDDIIEGIRGEQTHEARASLMMGPEFTG
jgi:hypothetical protein